MCLLGRPSSGRCRHSSRTAGESLAGARALFLGGAYYYQQRFSPTFIPYKSAKGNEGPVGGNSYAVVPSPFTCSDCWAELNRSGVHGNFDALQLWGPLLGKLDSIASSCRPTVFRVSSVSLRLSR